MKTQSIFLRGTGCVAKVLIFTGGSNPPHPPVYYLYCSHSRTFHRAGDIGGDMQIIIVPQQPP